MGYFDCYCAYHQRRGHSTNFSKDLEAIILDLIVEGKYEISQNASNLEIVETRMGMYKIENFDPLIYVKELGQQKIFSIEGFTMLSPN